MKSIVDLKVGSVVYSKTGFRKLARDNGLGKGDSFIGEAVPEKYPCYCLCNKSDRGVDVCIFYMDQLKEIRRVMDR